MIKWNSDAFVGLAVDLHNMLFIDYIENIQVFIRFYNIPQLFIYQLSATTMLGIASHLP